MEIQYINDMDVTNDCCCYCMFLEHPNTSVEKRQADEQHSLAVLQEPMYKPHLSQKPKSIEEEQNISHEKEAAATTSSNTNCKSANKSRSVSVATSEEGIVVLSAVKCSKTA